MRKKTKMYIHPARCICQVHTIAFALSQYVFQNIARPIYISFRYSKTLLFHFAVTSLSDYPANRHKLTFCLCSLALSCHHARFISGQPRLPVDEMTYFRKPFLLKYLHDVRALLARTCVYLRRFSNFSKHIATVNCCTNLLPTKTDKHSLSVNSSCLCLRYPFPDVPDAPFIFTRFTSGTSGKHTKTAFCCSDIANKKHQFPDQPIRKCCFTPLELFVLF